MIITKATMIVDAIIKDLRGRRGLKHEWEMIDEDVQEELTDTWIRIAEKVLDDNN